MSLHILWTQREKKVWRLSGGGQTDAVILKLKFRMQDGGK